MENTLPMGLLIKNKISYRQSLTQITQYKYTDKK